MISLQVNQQRKIRKHLKVKLKKKAVHHKVVVKELQDKIRNMQYIIDDLRYERGYW